MEGLQKGEVSIFEGESRLFINDYTENQCHAYGNNVYWIRLRGKADPNLQNPLLKLHLYTSCSDPRPNVVGFPQLTGTVEHEVTLTPGETFDISVKVSGGKGVYSAVLKGTGPHYLAISKAIIIK